MAKQIVWSPLAVQKRSDILTFWIKKNKSDIYSKKLNKLFKEASHLISIHSDIGKPTQMVMFDLRLSSIISCFTNSKIIRFIF